MVKLVAEGTAELVAGGTAEFEGNMYCTWRVSKGSVLIFYLIIYWTYLKLQVISFEV
jgi:hypothetical protein